MNRDPFEDHLKRFKVSNPDPDLRSRVLRSAGGRKHVVAFGSTLSEVFRTCKWEFVLGAAVLVMVLANVAVDRPGEAYRRVAESNPVLESQARELAAELGDGEALTRVVYRQLVRGHHRGVALSKFAALEKNGYR
jgi:hypothetical protein